MVKTCNQCGKTVGTPGAVGFVRTGLPAAIVAGLLVGLLARLSSWFMLAALPIWLLFGWLFWEAPGGSPRFATDSVAAHVAVSAIGIGPTTVASDCKRGAPIPVRQEVIAES